MFLRKICATILAVTLAVASVGASAQECGYSARRVSEIDRDIANTIFEYPGTHAGLLACGAGADDEQRRTGNRNSAMQSFVICMGIVCFFAGADSCITVAQRWYTLTTERSRLQSYRSRYC